MEPGQAARGPCRRRVRRQIPDAALKCYGEWTGLRDAEGMLLTARGDELGLRLKQKKMALRRSRNDLIGRGAFCRLGTLDKKDDHELGPGHRV